MSTFRATAVTFPIIKLRYRYIYIKNKQNGELENTADKEAQDKKAETDVVETQHL